MEPHNKQVYVCLNDLSLKLTSRKQTSANLRNLELFLSEMETDKLHFVWLSQSSHFYSQESKSSLDSRCRILARSLVTAVSPFPLSPPPSACPPFFSAAETTPTVRKITPPSKTRRQEGLKKESDPGTRDHFVSGEEGAFCCTVLLSSCLWNFPFAQ